MCVTLKPNTLLSIGFGDSNSILWDLSSVQLYSPKRAIVDFVATRYLPSTDVDAAVERETSGIVNWWDSPPERNATAILIDVQRQCFLSGNRPNIRSAANLQSPPILTRSISLVRKAPVSHATVTASTNRGYVAGRTIEESLGLHR